MAKVRLTEIQFSPTQLLSAESLQAIGQKYVGRLVDRSDIQALLDEVSALYQAKGILTAVPVLPPQDLRRGTLRILLVEGKLGQVVVRQSGRANPNWVKAWFDLPLQQVVTAQALNEKLQRFNFASDFSATASFIAGQRFGESHLQIDVAGTDPVQRWALLETVARGKNDLATQLAAGLRIAPASSVGGRVDTAVLHSDAGTTLTATVALPIDTSGWRLSVTGGWTRSNTTQASTVENVADLSIDGRANTFSAELSRGWVLPGPWVVTTALQMGRQSSDTFVLDISSQYQVDRVSMVGTLNHDNEKGRSAMRLAYTLAQSKSSALDGARAESAYQTWDAYASHHAEFDAQRQWMGKVGLSVKRTVTGTPGVFDRFQLGTPDTVRGWSGNEITGDEGAAVQWELRRRLPSVAGMTQAEAYAFVDKGYVQSAGQRQQVTSFGLGAQARLTPQLGMEIQLSQARSAQEKRLQAQLRLVASW